MKKIGITLLMLVSLISVSGARDRKLAPRAIKPAPLVLTITTAAMPTATVGKPYSAQLNATGGAAPYNWYAQNLPAGLTIRNLNRTVGIISGTPTTAGTYDVVITVSDKKNTRYMLLRIVE